MNNKFWVVYGIYYTPTRQITHPLVFCSTLDMAHFYLECFITSGEYDDLYGELIIKEEELTI